MPNFQKFRMETETIGTLAQSQWQAPESRMWLAETSGSGERPQNPTGMIKKTLRKPIKKGNESTIVNLLWFFMYMSTCHAHDYCISYNLVFSTWKGYFATMISAFLPSFQVNFVMSSGAGFMGSPGQSSWHHLSWCFMSQGGGSLKKFYKQDMMKS